MGDPALVMLSGHLRPAPGAAPPSPWGEQVLKGGLHAARRGLDPQPEQLLCPDPGSALAGQCQGQHVVFAPF